MSTEVLLLLNIAGLTLVAYMVAINSHGPTRLGLSYLIATIMLAGTVWVVVQHVNMGLDMQNREKLKQLGQEKQAAEELLRAQREAMMAGKERSAAASEINEVVAKGATLATRIAHTDLQDRSVDLDGLLGRAAATAREATELKKEFEELEPDTFFQDARGMLKEAIEALTEAAYLYRSYYHSEDSDQEELRERIMRQKSRAAGELFDKVKDRLSSPR
jgi:hypothetical protein